MFYGWRALWFKAESLPSPWSYLILAVPVAFILTEGALLIGAAEVAKLLTSEAKSSAPRESASYTEPEAHDPG